MDYRNSHDPDFIDAARFNILFLDECRDFCNHVIKKMEADAIYRDLMWFVNNPYSDRDLATAYRHGMEEAIERLEHPETSTPVERRNARRLIAQVRSWGIKWDEGAVLRDGVYGAVVPPTKYDAMTYMSPVMIGAVVVPVVEEPGYDPFADGVGG